MYRGGMSKQMNATETYIANERLAVVDLKKTALIAAPSSILGT